MSDITWTIVSVTLDQLQPWDGNPKTSTAKNQAQLNDSADDLGQFQTIAIGPFDGNGKALVYDGHQRLSAWKAKHGGKLAVQALQSSRPLTDQERRKIAIYSRQIGAWDWDVLSAWEPTELTAWGFDVDLLRDWGRDYSNLAEMLEAGEEWKDIPNLDELTEQYGDPQERDFWPFIRVQVSPETYEQWESFMDSLPGDDEAAKMASILEAVDATILGAILP